MIAGIVTFPKMTSVMACNRPRDNALSLPLRQLLIEPSCFSRQLFHRSYFAHFQLRISSLSMPSA
jgi:hypothetical protein